MKIHEYQAKELLRKYGVTTPRGIPCFTIDEAVAKQTQLLDRTCTVNYRSAFSVIGDALRWIFAVSAFFWLPLTTFSTTARS